jgi:hypothetical protein
MNKIWTKKCFHKNATFKIEIHDRNKISTKLKWWFVNHEIILTMPTFTRTYCKRTTEQKYSSMECTYPPLQKEVSDYASFTDIYINLSQKRDKSKNQ